MTIEMLNTKFKSYSVVNRIERLYQFYSPEEVLFTSSFGTNSAYLLHLINRVKPEQKVHFIDTGYHFSETLEYKNALTKVFGLKVVDLKSDNEDFSISNYAKLWLSNPELCCYLNKVLPLEAIKPKYKVWISGLVSTQTEFRSSLPLFEKRDTLLKFHPLIDSSSTEIKAYQDYFKLPKHPLYDEGYESIGCQNCTQKGCGRLGRWAGVNKTECGLHPGYFAERVEANQTQLNKINS